MTVTPLLVNEHVDAVMKRVIKSFNSEKLMDNISDLQNIFRMAHGSQLQTSVPSLTGSAGGVLSLWQTSLEASDGYPAKRYSRLLHWSYRNFLHVFLIYSVEIHRMVPGKTSGTHFPDVAAHSPGPGSPPLSARGIPSYIRPVCS